MVTIHAQRRPILLAGAKTNRLLVVLLVVLGDIAFVHPPLLAQDSVTEAAVPLPESGESCEALVSFDRLMRSFLAKHEIPGAALAVTRNRQLIYARGFGYADRDAREPVQPDTAFRIASIAKPITSASILRLVDQGLLNLDDLVMKRLPHLGQSGSSLQPDDSRWSQITVRQVLQHQGGWDRGLAGDPMFRSTDIAKELAIAVPPGPTDIVRFMMGQPLDFDPGQRYAYSNFGYCVLGRIIEQATGEDYESAVEHRLLEPLGITRMCIGRTFREQRAVGEACYYESGDPAEPALFGPRAGQPVPIQYGTWYHEALDAHGGWIGSAIDLVRFATVVQHAHPDGLLTPSMLNELRARPARPPSLPFAPRKQRYSRGAKGDFLPADRERSPSGEEVEGAADPPVYYGLGWSVRELADSGRVNLWHTGLLPGTSTLLVVRHDGLCWCVLFNTSHTADGRVPVNVIDPLLHKAAAEVKNWPSIDRFADFLTAPTAGR